MLNQIRKLIGILCLLSLGMVIMIMRLDVQDYSMVISRSLSKSEKMNVPKAPGVGLLLAQV